MYKEAIIYYPKDEKIRRQIQKNVARFHCDAVIQYLDGLNFTIYQKVAIFESVLESMRQSNPDLVVSDTSPSDKTLHHLHFASDEKEVAKCLLLATRHESNTFSAIGTVSKADTRSITNIATSYQATNPIH